MKNRRTYDFGIEPRVGSGNTVVHELLVDGWSAYYRWRARLRKRMAAKRPK